MLVILMFSWVCFGWMELFCSVVCSWLLIGSLNCLDGMVFW